MKFLLDGRLIRTPTSLYTYDALDRLTSVTKDGITTTYTYDSFNRRLTKSGAFFLYDGQREIGCYQNGHMTEFRTLAPTESEIGSAIGIEINNATYVPIHDITGSVTDLLDTNGNLVESYRYTAFGEEAFSCSLNPWRFASKRYDAESGLVYFGNRYYDPYLGCWISPDPIGYEDGPNLYAYVSNNPLTHYDAYGLLEEDESEAKNTLPKNTQHQQDFEIVNEDTYDVYDRPRDWFGNSQDDWENISICNSCEDFYSSVCSSTLNPLGVISDMGDPSYINKSYGTIAGEAVGLGASLATITFSATSEALVKVGSGSKVIFNPRTYQNIKVVTKIANISKNYWKKVKNALTLVNKNNKITPRDETSKTPVRTEPRNLTEQLVLKEAQSGEGIEILKGKIKDPRYSQFFWKKMSHDRRNPDCSRIEIHYWQNRFTRKRKNFKFKDN